jgi:hypothetical protein
MMVKGVAIGAAAMGGSILATVVWCLWAENKSKTNTSNMEVDSAPSPIPLEALPDHEDVYDHEVGLVVNSLPKRESLEFGRYFDSLGSLLSSCPSDAATSKLSDIALIGIVARNRLWNLSGHVPYASAVAGLVWAEREMRQVVEDSASSAEWLKAGLHITEEFFGLLRLSQHQAQTA